MTIKMLWDANHLMLRHYKNIRVNPVPPVDGSVELLANSSSISSETAQ